MPEWWPKSEHYCEDHKCLLGPKMQKITKQGVPKRGEGKSDTWEVFPKDPVF